MALYKQTEQICRELGKDGLQRTLGNQANILYARGDLDGAMALHKQKEQICRELGSIEGLAISLVNQAELLADKMAHPQQALPLAEQAYRLAHERDLIALARQIRPILDSVRQAARGE
jgi:tetratricopeptide (TPR) repeat protein